MNRKLVSIILLVVLLAIALVAAIPAAADEPVNVDPVVGGTYVVSADDNIHLYYWWWSLNPGHINTYLKGNKTTFTLRDANDKIVWSMAAADAALYWSDPFKTDFSAWFDYPMPWAWASAWEYPLGSLAPGTYTLTTVIVLKHPINDSGHLLRDKDTGERILPVPSIFPAGSYTYLVTIMVE